MNINFKPINLDKHFNYCYEFRRDSHFCSFGNADGYEESVIGYYEKIQQRQADPRWHYLHIWQGENVIGQLEFKSFSFMENTGYVHLVYLIPECRGSGIAGEAQQLIAKELKKQHCHSALLSVSRSNERAIKHYRRFGWSYLKPNPKDQVTDYYIRQFSEG